MTPLSRASLRALTRLRAYQSPPTIYSSLPLTRRAAVLILLFADPNGDLRVVLTVRASTLKSFPGQAAFPGGKADSLLETPFQTARREADEEIGLPSDDGKLVPPFRVEHLCELPVHLARTELAVRPCVAYLNAGDQTGTEVADVERSLIPRLDAREVAAVFSAPFHTFLKKSDELCAGAGPSVPSDGLQWYDGSWTTWHEKRLPMHSFFVPLAGHPVATPRSAHHGPGRSAAARRLREAEEEGSMTRFRVWGMTARIMVDAARVAYDERPEFEHPLEIGDEILICRLHHEGKLPEITRPHRPVYRDASKDSKI
ncbi:MAG: hypothetical protein M1838_004323 [Thelocarpon superellum]|nr:MAG: hypothetical protein M1838_004323 [Thelocarpon superellum]